MTQTDTELLPTRASLIRRLKHWHDDSGWREFFRIYWRLIYGIARRAGLTDAEAQDVVQETLVAVAKRMPNFEYDPAIGAFKVWLLNLTRWWIAEEFRKRQQQAAVTQRSTQSGVDSSGADLALGAPNLAAVWEAEWQSNLFRAALDKLRRRGDPERYQIFDCYVNRDWPPAKVADRFSVSLDQVYQTKHRFAELLREEVLRLEREMT